MVQEPCSLGCFCYSLPHRLRWPSRQRQQVWGCHTQNVLEKHVLTRMAHDSPFLGLTVSPSTAPGPAPAGLSRTTTLPDKLPPLQPQGPTVAPDVSRLRNLRHSPEAFLSSTYTLSTAPRVTCRCSWEHHPHRWGN